MTFESIKTALSEDYFSQTFSILYGKESYQAQKERYLAALTRFKQIFNPGRTTEVSLFSAPGRTEIAGNHTDHQHGFVLAASVNMDVIAVVTKTEGEVIIQSEGYPQDRVSLADLSLRQDEMNTASALIRGILAWFKEKGYNIGGFKAYTTSAVLKGSGLSSSAAFETLIGCILSHLYNEGTVNAVAIALAGQYAENTYFGKPCGLMDQLACAVGDLIAIDFKEPTTPVIEKVRLNLNAQNHTLCVVDTGGNHADLTQDYADIPADLEKVCSAFRQSALRDIDELDFYAALPMLRVTHGDRPVLRAIHIYEENKRVQAIIDAIRTGDFHTFLTKIKQSGHSSFCYLQNVYAPHHTNEQGLSLAYALSVRILGDQGAFRVQGGGFAGTLLAFVPNAILPDYETELNRVFGANACHRLNLRTVGACLVE